MILKKRWKRGIFFFLSLLSCSIVQGNIINGGVGLVHVRSALNLKPGHLILYTQNQAFGKIDHTTPTAFWVIQNAFSLNFGISDHVELSISPILYQDTHKGSTGYNFPDDLFIGLKFGSYIFQESSVAWSISLDGRFPTGECHNIFFEPYSAGRFSWECTGMISYIKNLDYFNESLIVDFNLSYLNHNDAGQKLSGCQNDPSPVSHVSQEFSYGFGINLPTSIFDFSFELFGNMFYQPPPETAYGLENYLYFTPTIKYKATNWLTISAGLDFRLSRDIDETCYEFVSRPVPDDFPNYPNWRVRMGFKFLLLPIKDCSVSKKDLLLERANVRRKLFEEIIDEQRETEAIEEEFEQIKAERIKAEKIIERLRQILEQDQKKKEPANKDRQKKPPPQ
jgi:hypothetical protein